MRLTAIRRPAACGDHEGASPVVLPLIPASYEPPHKKRQNRRRDVDLGPPHLSTG
jgi:hypothetical protein